MEVTAASLSDFSRALDAVQLAKDCGISPDPWQETVLRSSARRLLLLATRQGGKSTVSALVALHTALYEPGSTILLVSPSQRQSGELFRAHVVAYYNQLPDAIPLSSQTQLTMEFSNGSRIISLPGDEATVRGYSDVDLLVLDEASRIPDELYRTVRPMLAVSQGRLIALSTPAGKRGWFFDEWIGSGNWERYEARAGDCPRITKEFLDEERQSLGDRWYRQEYQCSFEDVVDAVFSQQEIAAAFDNDLEPLFAA